MLTTFQALKVEDKVNIYIVLLHAEEPIYQHSNFLLYFDLIFLLLLSELLLCRKCGADVADSNYLFSKLSPGARKTEKQNLFGKQNVTVQTLVNPFGVKFEIVTTEKARCDNVGLVSFQNQLN